LNKLNMILLIIPVSVIIKDYKIHAHMRYSFVISGLALSVIH